MAAPKLYQYDVCPFCSKVKAALYYKKIPYDAIEVHPLNKKELAFTPDYKKVPVYIDSKGQQVNDSTPIMRHIDNEFPFRPFTSLSSVEKEQEEKWMEWSNGYVRTIPPLIYRTFGDALKAFDYITHKGNFSWIQRRTVKYSGALVMKLVAKKTAKQLNIIDPVSHFEGKLNEWTEALDGKKFLGGETPNIADLSVFGITHSMNKLPAMEICKENPQFWKWMQSMASETNMTLA